MGNIYKDIIQEIYHRIDICKDTIDIGIKRVAIGPRELSESLVDTPSVVIEFIRGNENLNIHATRMLESKIDIILNCKYPCFDEKTNNMYYNETTEKGLIYFIEELLDCINESRNKLIDSNGDFLVDSNGDNITNTGYQDSLLSGYARECIKADIREIMKKDNMFVFEIILNITSRNFSFGGRQY